jgi:L,D-transpeptidase ErfK/SrfK
MPAQELLDQFQHLTLAGTGFGAGGIHGGYHTFVWYPLKAARLSSCRGRARLQAQTFMKTMLKTKTYIALLLAAISAPCGATAYDFLDPQQSVFGADLSIQTAYEDTLYDLARHYSLGSEELIRVNPGVDPWIPGSGKTVLVPGRHILPSGPREGLVINIAEHRLYYYPKPKRHQPQQVITYPVSIGKMDWRTPLGDTRVIAKQKDPWWTPTESVRAEHAKDGDILPARVPPGPDNPLGDRALRLAAGQGTYLIHGTNNPIAVGLAVTHGCIRMYPEDINALFPEVAVGTKVRIVNEPVKVAWVDGELLLEAHPPVDAQGQSHEPDVDRFSELLRAAVGESTVAIHWDYAREVLQRADGVLAVVGLAAELPAEPVPEAAPETAPVMPAEQPQTAPEAPGG